MPSFNTSHQKSVPPTHQNFRWIHGPGQEDRLAGFVELTRDLSAGVHACLQIIYSSDLVREINLDGDLEQVSAPAISKTEASALFRLSVAATALSCEAADKQVDLLNSTSTATATTAIATAGRKHRKPYCPSLLYR